MWFRFCTAKLSVFYIYTRSTKDYHSLAVKVKFSEKIGKQICRHPMFNTYVLMNLGIYGYIYNLLIN